MSTIASLHNMNGGLSISLGNGGSGGRGNSAGGAGGALNKLKVTSPRIGGEVDISGGTDGNGGDNGDDNGGGAGAGGALSDLTIITSSISGEVGLLAAEAGPVAAMVAALVLAVHLVT